MEQSILVELGKYTWDTLVEAGLDDLLSNYVASGVVSRAHVKETPKRYTKALKEMFRGVKLTPQQALNTLFPVEGAPSMIHVKEITYFSVCSHHLVPFFGKMSFAYIPSKHIVGLSKIPRLIDVYARRPQVQENLTNQIVDAFMEIVNPAGCGLMVNGYHMCMMARGVEEPCAYTQTTALRGCFDNSDVKAEFLASALKDNWKVF